MGVSVRVKGGADPRWYNPERDGAYIGAGLLRGAIERATDKVKDNPELYAALGKAAGELGGLIGKAKQAGISDADLKAGIAQLDPQVAGVIGWEFMSLYLEQYREWVGDVTLVTKKE